MTSESDEYQRLLEFFYQCPTGLISIADDGAIQQINPAALNLLTVAFRTTAFDNLYECLRHIWPALETLIAGHPKPGVIAEDRDLTSTHPPFAVIACTVVRIATDRVMFVATDATTRADIEQQRADLFQSVQQARGRLETLERSATQLVGASTVDDVAAVLTNVLNDSAGLDLVTMRTLRDDHLDLVLGPGVPAALSEAAARVPIDAGVPGLVAVRDNRSIHVESTAAILEQFPLLGAHLGMLTIGSLVALPLRAADKSPIGALVVASRDEHGFDEDVLSLLSGIADQGGLALERAQLFEAAIRAREQEHAIALRLQQALLPDRLASVPGVEIAARVKAASDLMAVGGDWYDTLAWPSGEIGLMVGDVVDHDIEAATKMGKLRSAVAALAPRIEPSARGLAETIDHVAHLDTDIGFATAACVVLEPRVGRLRYVLAGHPPPVIVGPAGPAAQLTGGRSLPIGIVDSVDRVEAEVTLLPGTVIVVYSDGLVERRNQVLDVGIQMLGELVESMRDRRASAQEIADELMDRAHLIGDTDDDVLVVVMTWAGPSTRLSSGKQDEQADGVAGHHGPEQRREGALPRLRVDRRSRPGPERHQRDGRERDEHRRPAEQFGVREDRRLRRVAGERGQ